MAWHIKIKAYVAQREPVEAGTLMITDLSVGRPGSKAADTLFHPCEKIQVRTTVNESAYLQIFGVERSGLVARLYPVATSGQERLKGKEQFVFPTRHEMKFGLKIKTSQLRGMNSTVESILVIATKKKVRFLEGKHIEHPTITDVMRELALYDQSPWATRVVSYDVR
jgi:hypothetical protein